MTLYAVHDQDLQNALTSARTEASHILEQVNFVQQELANTTFVGESAELLAGEMNAKMLTFVTATYDNVDELLRVIVNNMNVVVTKLGGDIWTHTPVARGSRVEAEALRSSGNTDYEIDTDEMAGFANKVDGWFEGIATSYRNVRATIAEGTPRWHGPEKIATVTAVSDAVETIVGTAGGETGVLGVGSSLSGWVREQVSVMESA